MKRTLEPAARSGSVMCAVGAIHRPSFRYKVSHHAIVVMLPNLHSNSVTSHERRAQHSVCVPHVCSLVALNEGDTLLLHDICPLWLKQKHVRLANNETLVTGEYELSHSLKLSRHCSPSSPLHLPQGNQVNVSGRANKLDARTYRIRSRGSARSLGQF